MSKERELLFKGRPSREYSAAREKGSLTIEIPQLKKYQLSTPEGQTSFLKSLDAFPEKTYNLPWTATKNSDLLTEALTRGVLVDRVDLYLEDDAKLKRPKGYFSTHEDILERYKSIYDNWENSTIIEYPWEQKGRFVRVPNEKDFDRIAFSRNNYVIPPEVQEKLRDTKFAIDGLGVGTSIAYLLVLSGAKNFRVVDGGEVNLHDHNRLLGADIRESGLNHAIHWSRSALKVNPYLNIDCIPQNLGDGTGNTISIERFLDGVGVVIEEADDLPIKVSSRFAAKQSGIPVIMGTDLGTSGLVQWETPDVADPIFNGRLTPYALNILQDPQADFSLKTAVAVDVIVGSDNIPPEYGIALSAAGRDNAPYWPQVGIGAFASARGVSMAVMNLFAGKTLQNEQKIA